VSIVNIFFLVKIKFSIKHPDILRHGWIYGGDFAVRSLFCAYRTVPKGMCVNSFHSYFCSPGFAKPHYFKVDRLLDTRNRAWRRVEVKQDDKIIYHAEFMFKMVRKFGCF
jgi:acyl-CoA thioesterase II